MLIQGPQGPMLASAPAPPPGVRLAPVLAPPGAPPPPAITNPPLPPAPPAAGAAPIITWGAQGPIGPPAGAPLGTAVLPIPPHLQQQQWAPHVDPTTGQILGPPVTVPPTAPGAGPFPVPPPAAQFFPVAGPQGQQPPPPPPQGGAAVPPPQRLDVVRDFVWQEKVHSVTEVAAARRLAELHEAAGGAPAGDGGDPRLLGLSGRARRYRPLGSHVDGQQPGNKKTSALVSGDGAQRWCACVFWDLHLFGRRGGAGAQRPGVSGVCVCARVWRCACVAWRAGPQGAGQRALHLCAQRRLCRARGAQQDRHHQRARAAALQALPQGHHQRQAAPGGAWQAAVRSGGMPEGQAKAVALRRHHQRQGGG